MRHARPQRLLAGVRVHESLTRCGTDSAAISSAIADAVSRAGLGKLSGGRGVAGIFSDPDGIEIQFLPAPDTLVTAAVPADLVEPKKGLLRPRGIDHVLLHVADLGRGVQFYQILYGTPAVRETDPARVWFQIGDTRLGLEQVQQAGSRTSRTSRSTVAGFNRPDVMAGITKLGAQVVASPEESDVLRFQDPDGIHLELRAV